MEKLAFETRGCVQGCILVIQNYYIYTYTNYALSISSHVDKKNLAIN